MMFHLSFISAILFTGPILLVKSQSNNVCETFADYAIMNISKKCSYNPIVHADMPELVTLQNYPVETHTVITKDGYVGKIFRLPRSDTKKGSVLLYHPSSTTCTVYLDKGNESLGIYLYNEGYDVWLGNLRGDFYAKNHTTLDVSSKEFWNFSFHEIGLGDIPAHIEYIRSKTNTGKIGLLGQSMSGAASLVYASLMPEHAEVHVKVIVLMIPAVYLNHDTTPLRYLGKLVPTIVEYLENSGVYYLFARGERMTQMISQFCSIPVGMKLCYSGGQIIQGVDADYQVPIKIPVAYGQAPDSLSVKNIAHLAQGLTEEKTFRELDHGIEENLRIYGTSEAPQYPIKNLRNKVYIIGGGSDGFVSDKDLRKLYNNLPHKFGFDILKGYNHYHFSGYGKGSDKINVPVAGAFDRAFKK